MQFRRAQTFFSSNTKSGYGFKPKEHPSTFWALEVLNPLDLVSRRHMDTWLVWQERQQQLATGMPARLHLHAATH